MAHQEGRKHNSQAANTKAGAQATPHEPTWKTHERNGVKEKQKSRTTEAGRKARTKTAQGYRKAQTKDKEISAEGWPRRKSATKGGMSQNGYSVVNMCRLLGNIELSGSEIRVTSS